MENNPFSTRSLAVILIISFAVTGGNIWLNWSDIPLGYTVYDGYGFSFQHIESINMHDELLTDSNSMESGSIQGEIPDGFEVLGIVWFTNDTGDLDDALDWLFEVAAGAAGVTGRDDKASLSIQDISMRYQIFTYQEQDLVLRGIIGAWKAEDGRTFIVYTLVLGADETQLTNKVKAFVKSFETDKAPPRALDAYWPTEGWRKATPSEMGVDETRLERMISDIERSSYTVDSAMVIKDGYVVLEEYFSDYDEDDLHKVYSCTKSVISTLIGIAIDKGQITDLDERLVDIYPEYVYENPSENKENITLRNLLMMSAGFDARDNWEYQWEGLYTMHEAEDAVQYMLDLPLHFEPGSRFQYTNGVSHLLSCILTTKTGQTAEEYAIEHLFTPLGITRFRWGKDTQNKNWGYSELELTPRDMAKIGYLFLNEGEWDGEQIVSKEWVEEATKHRIDANIKQGYGYQWWIDDGWYLALGYRGQFIMVFPEQNTVAVFTGSSPETFDYTIQLADRFILPAVT